MALHYNKKVLEYFRNPKQAGELKNPDGVATEGSPACGDMITTYLKINPETRVIEDVKFKSYGCASNIATASIVAEKAVGKTIDEVKKLDVRTAAQELGGLPAVKMHCSVLAVNTLKAAIRNFERKHGLETNEALTEDVVRQELYSVFNPEMGANIMRLKMVKSIAINDGNIMIDVSLGNTDEMYANHIKGEIIEHVKTLHGVKEVEVNIIKK